MVAGLGAVSVPHPRTCLRESRCSLSTCLQHLILQLFVSVSYMVGSLLGRWQNRGEVVRNAGATGKACSWVARTNMDHHQALTDLWDPRERQQEGTDCRSGPRTTALVSLRMELKG